MTHKTRITRPLRSSGSGLHIGAMQPHHNTNSSPTGAGEAPARVAWFPHLASFLIYVFIIASLFRSDGRASEREIPITRNIAWNDLLHQLDLAPDPVPHETVGQKLVVIQKFLKDHQTELRVDLYDIAVFNAIDEARARLQQADKDLKAIRDALSYREYQAGNRR